MLGSDDWKNLQSDDLNKTFTLMPGLQAGTHECIILASNDVSYVEKPVEINICSIIRKYIGQPPVTFDGSLEGRLLTQFDKLYYFSSVGIDHTLNFHLNAAPVKISLESVINNDHPVVKPTNVCHQKASCANHKLNVKFVSNSSQKFVLKAKNCADEKQYLLNLKPQIFFLADVIYEMSFVKIYVKKTPFPIQLTVSNQRGVIIQAEDFLMIENSTVYPSSHFQYIRFSDKFLSLGESSLNVNVLNKSNKSIIYDKDFNLFRSFCSDFTVSFETPKDFVISSTDFFTGTN